MSFEFVMPLATATITAVAAVAAAAVAGYWGYRSVKASSDASNLKDQAASLKHELAAAYRQIAAYHRLEEDLSQHIAELDQAATRTIKTRFRDLATSDAGERPRITAKQAMNRVRELEP